MNSLSLQILVVGGLLAGFVLAACTDQSIDDVNQVQQETGQKSESVVENPGRDPAPATGDEDISEQERKELQQWLDGKILEAEKHEAEIAREGQ